MDTTDHQLIAESLSGRTESFGRLVLRYQDRLFNSLVNVSGSVEDARDVAQEAFVQAFQKLQSFRGQSAFYSWLFRIAVNCSVDQHRRNHRPVASLDSLREDHGAEPADAHPESHPAFGLERSERQQLVRRALGELSDEYRTVLVLKELEDLSYEQIAAIVGCPIGTVRSRIHRARQELRARLSAAGAGPNRSALAGSNGSLAGAAVPAAAGRKT